MAEKAIKRDEIALDPMFFIPDGMDEYVYIDTEDLFLDEDGQVEEEYLDDSFLVDDDTDYSERPGVPKILGIVPPQVFRTTLAGNQVVDIVIEVEDIPGISKYEFRVTKI